MSSSLKALLARIPDEALRAELAAAIAETQSTAEFGLVFEKHLPETVRLPHHPSAAASRSPTATIPRIARCSTSSASRRQGDPASQSAR